MVLEVANVVSDDVTGMRRASPEALSNRYFLVRRQWAWEHGMQRQPSWR